MRYRNLMEKLPGILGQVEGTGPLARRRFMRQLAGNGFLKNEDDLQGFGQLMEAFPGFSAKNAASFGDVDSVLSELRGGYGLPVGHAGGRFTDPAGLDDPRDDGDTDRADCDLYCIGSDAVVVGDTTSQIQVTGLNQPLHKCVLWWNNPEGQVLRITNLQVDGRPFYLGDAGVLPVEVGDINLEPHPLRCGVYVEYIKEKVEITAAVDVNAGFTWLLLADAAVERPEVVRPQGRLLHKAVRRPRY